jgi:hypothetical protein
MSDMSTDSILKTTSSGSKFSLLPVVSVSTLAEAPFSDFVSDLQAKSVVVKQVSKTIDKNFLKLILSPFSPQLINYTLSPYLYQVI